MSSIHLKIISPVATIFSGNCYLVKLQTKEGEIGIASRHQSIITQLTEGVVAIYNHQQQLIEQININGGLCQFVNNATTVDGSEIDDEMVILAKSF
jgi:F0F1-type ATP synthase epsilon subunit